MTTLQLRVVVATAELGSISAAAKLLNLSQPNASNSIKLLEEEIGFSIFYRASGGTTLTKKGSAFLNHARQILEENEKIMRIQSTDDVYQLRLGGVNYNTCINPFLTLCAEHRNDPETDFRYFSVSVEEGISDLVKRNLDIVIAPVMKHQISGLVNECKKNNISITSLCTIPAIIAVREGHPAALDGRCRNIRQGSDVMKEFPYVAYRNLFEDAGSTGYNDSDFIQCSYKMYVDEIDVRLRLAANTNAFLFGILSADNLLERYGLVYFPVPGISLEAFCLIRPEDAERREIKDYLTLLKKEFYYLLK